MSNYHDFDSDVCDLLNNRCLFIIDGLDEITKNDNYIRELISDIQEHSVYSKVVLACRYKEYRNLEYDMIPTVTLQNMDYSVMEKLAGNIYKSYHKNNKSIYLLESIKKKKIDASVYGVPLFFSLIVGLYIETEQLVSTNKSAVLHESVKLLLSRKQHLLNKTNLKLDTVLSTIEKVAYVIQKNLKNDSPRIKTYDIGGIIGENLSSSSFDAVIYYLKDNAGIISEVVERNSTSFEFSHRYFQEYLCASYISKMKSADAARILQVALSSNQVQWIEVLLLYIDIMHDNENYEILWTVIYVVLKEATDESEPWAIWFACKALASNNYYLLPKNYDQYDERNDLTLNLLTEKVKNLLKEESRLPLQYKKECLDTLGELEPDRKGTGLVNGIPDHWWCEIEDRGPFIMGLTNDDIQKIKRAKWGKNATLERETPAKKVAISSFYISKYPTTIRQFMAFVMAEDGYQFKEWWDWSSLSMSWFNRTDISERKKTFEELPKNIYYYPITNINFYEAIEYYK